MTQHVDLMVRDHPRLEEKLKQFAKAFGVRLTRPYEPTSQVIRATGRPVMVDFVRTLSSRKSFASIRSRAIRVRVGNRMVWVASLDDVIASKEAAGRPKDKATLEILRQTRSVTNALKQTRGIESRLPTHHKIVSKHSPAFTACPSTTQSLSTVPDLGAVSSFCIFMASTTATP
jgi:hypothetical protein